MYLKSPPKEISLFFEASRHLPPLELGRSLSVLCVPSTCPRTKALFESTVSVGKKRE